MEAGISQANQSLTYLGHWAGETLLRFEFD